MRQMLHRRVLRAFGGTEGLTAPLADEQLDILLADQAKQAEEFLDEIEDEIEAENARLHKLRSPIRFTLQDEG